MSEKPSHFSPKQVAGSLHVSESSVKRWCDQGVIPTIRTVGGHRRITVSGLQAFLAATDRELADSSALGIDLKQLNGSSANGSSANGSSANGSSPNGASARRRRPETLADDCYGDDLASVRQRFLRELAKGNEETCVSIVESHLKAGWTRAEIAEDLITDAMRNMGDAWDCGDIEVYQERRSCTICTRLIFSLRDSLADTTDDAPVAIGGAPESDPYQLPTSLVELALRERGWNAFNLGNDLPLESMIQAVHDYQPSLVWLSVTSVADKERFVSEQNRLADAIPADVAFIVGGRGLDDALRPRLRYTAHCDSLRHLVEFAGKFGKRVDGS